LRLHEIDSRALRTFVEASSKPFRSLAVTFRVFIALLAVGKIYLTD
jgi:hypothetical protein